MSKIKANFLKCKVLSHKVLSREVLPFYASLAVLALVSLLFDALLHVLDSVWIGRYLGIPGMHFTDYFIVWLFATETAIN